MNILFVDDHVGLRTSLAEAVVARLEASVLEADTPEEGIALAKSSPTPIDLLVLDLEFPGRKGEHPVALFRREFPAQRILILSAHEDPESINEATRLGANSFIGKRQSLRQMVTAIELAGDGMDFIPPVRLPAATPQPKASAATTVDFDLLCRYLSEGLTAKEIAARMGRSPHTVRHHLTKLYALMGCRSRFEAVTKIIGDKHSAAP